MDFCHRLFGTVKDKAILVTGGARGIGAMISSGLIQMGARVYVASRDQRALETFAAEQTAQGPGICIAIVADLAKKEGVKTIVQTLQEKEPAGLYALINNAGANWGAPLNAYPDAAFDKVMHLNVRQVFALTRDLLPLLQKAATTSLPARIINIGSIDGLRTTALETYAYSASKAALHHLTRQLAAHVAPLITCNAVAPGPFPSKMMKATLEEHGDAIKSGVPMNRIGQTEDMVAVCLWLLGAGANYVTGIVIPVDGGILARASL